MERFDGTLRIAGSLDSVQATFEVAEGALRVTAGGQEIGAWALEEVGLSRGSGGLQLRVEGEELWIDVRDPDSLLEVVGGHEPPQPKRERIPLTTRLRSQFDMKTWRQRLRSTAVRWVLAFAAVLTLLAMAIFATGTLGMVLVLLGMVILVLAALAMSDDHSVYALLPPKITETGLVIAGFALVFIGIPLVFFS